MKLLILIISLAVFFHYTTADKFNVNCTILAPKKLPTSPKSGVWYQIVREAKKDAAKCYFFSLSTSGQTLTLLHSMYMGDNIWLNHTYTATGNTFGTFDVLMDNQKSSTIFIDSITDKFQAIYNCIQWGALTIQPGVYSTLKTALPKDDQEKIKTSLGKNKIAAGDIQFVDVSKC